MDINIVCMAIATASAGFAVWVREDARHAQRQVARLREALRPFADLVLEAGPEDPIPWEGNVHCLIMGDGELGELACRNFHVAAIAYASTTPRGEG